jgi:hypothetical protein
LHETSIPHRWARVKCNLCSQGRSLSSGHGSARYWSRRATMSCSKSQKGRSPDR